MLVKITTPPPGGGRGKNLVPFSPVGGGLKTAHRVHRIMARRLRAAASVSPSSTSTPPTTQMATARATESTSKPRAPHRVILVQASALRRLLSRLCGEIRLATLSKTLWLRLRPLVCTAPRRVGFVKRLRHYPLKPQHHRRRERPRHRPPSRQANYEHHFVWSWPKLVCFADFSHAWVVREG